MYYATCTKSDVKNFFGVFSIVFRVVPWLAFLIICRIGVFKLYAPTAIQDPLTMLPSLLNNSVLFIPNPSSKASSASSPKSS